MYKMIVPIERVEPIHRVFRASSKTWYFSGYIPAKMLTNGAQSHKQRGWNLVYMFTPSCLLVYIQCVCLCHHCMLITCNGHVKYLRIDGIVSDEIWM